MARNAKSKWAAAIERAPLVYSTTRTLTRDALHIFSARGARLMCASIAYYAIISVIPILVIALKVASWVLDPVDVDSTAETALGRWVGASGAHTLLELSRAASRASTSSFTNVLGALTLAYGSTRLFSQMTRALDLLWNAPEVPRGLGIAGGLLRQVKKRGLAFGMVLLVGLLLLALVLFHMALSWARSTVPLGSLPSFGPLEAFASFATTALLFALMFRVLPRARVRGKDALLAGAVTAVLFSLGATLVTAYVTRHDASVYGAAGTIVMLMLWVHYSAHAFFLGAAFTAAHAERRDFVASQPIGDILEGS
jgi:membrane protein